MEGGGEGGGSKQSDFRRYDYRQTAPSEGTGAAACMIILAGIFKCLY